MSNFWGFLDRIARFFTWWVIVTPWEQALRVRSGKHLSMLPPGIHLRVPIIDAIYKQSVRLRTVSLPVQTLTTRDGFTLTASGVFGYSIADLELLYRTLHHAEDTIRNKALGSIANYVQTHDRPECTPRQVAEGACASMNLRAYGLQCEELQLADFAFLKAYRFILDQKWGGTSDYLNTNSPVTTLQGIPA